MRRIRQYNDVTVYFSVTDSDGNPIMLPDNTAVQVWRNDHRFDRFTPEIILSGNTASFMVSAAKQTALGCYRAVMSYTLDDGTKGTADAVIFEVVEYSCQQGGAGECPGVDTDTVEVETCVCTGKKGDKGDKGDRGDPGKSAYQSFLDGGGDPTVTEVEFNESLSFATDISGLENTVAGHTTDIEALQGTVITGFAYNTQTRVMTLSVSDGSTKTITLPQASNLADGLMTSADVATIADLVNKVQSLIEGGVWRATFPTYADMAAAYPNLDVSGTNWFINDIVYVLADETHDGTETSYTVTDNGTTKTLIFRKTESTPIAQATNTTLGVVKGDNNLTPGKVYVESDGSQSLIGYDELAKKTEVSDSLAALTTVKNKSLSLLSGGWSQGPTYWEYAVNDADIVDGVHVSVVIDNDSLDAAKAVLPAPAFAPGIMTLLATAQPGEAINLTYSIIR